MGRRWAMTNDDRRKDAREKIALGGLIVKAGLRDANKAFLLGVLTEAARHPSGSSEHTRLEKLGKTAFGEAQE
jgi:Conjugal transfer protein TraD